MTNSEVSREQLVAENQELRHRLAELERLQPIPEGAALGTEMTTAISQVVDALVVYDHSLRYTYINESGASFLGLEPAQIIGKTNQEIIGPAADTIEAYIRNAFEQKEKGFVLHEIPLPNGVRFFDTVYIPIEDERGRVSRVVGVCRDVTEDRNSVGSLEKAPKTRDEELEGFQKKFQDLVNNAGQGILVAQDGMIKFVNPMCLEFTDYTEEELLGKSFLDFIDPDDRKLVTERHLGRMKGEQAPHRYEFRLKMKSGEMRWLEISSAFVSWEGRPASLCFLTDNTAEKLALEHLRESEERFRALSEATFEAIFLSEEGVCIGQNLTAEKMFGYTTEQARGKSGTEWIAPESRQTVLSNMRSGYEEPYEAVALRKDGTTFPCEIQGKMLNYQGRLIRVTALRDISKRKHAETELLSSEERFRTLIETMNEGFGVQDENCFIRYVNNKQCEMLGYSREELIGRKVGEFLAEENRRTTLDEFEELKEGHAGCYEVTFVRKDGERGNAIMSGTPVFDQEGNFKGSFGVATDITERKKMEEALKERERFLSDIFSSIKDGISILDNELNVIRINPTMEQWFPHDAPLVGKKCYHIYQKRTSPCDSCPSIRAIDSGQPAHEILPMTGPEGQIGGWIDVHAFPLVDSTSGQVTGVIEYVRNISDRKATEEERQRLFTAVEQAGEAIVVASATGSILYVNPAFEKTTGYSRQEVIGENPRILQSGLHDKKFYREIWETIGAGKVWRGHFSNRRKDGTLLEEEATISPIKDDSGNITSYVAVKRDVSTEALLRMQLLEAQKMEAVGTLAGGIAHDFNNLLQVILGYSDMLRLAKNEQDPDYEGLLAIRQAARDGGDLVNSLLTFSREAGNNPRPIDLNHQVKRVRKLLYRTIPKMIDIELFLADDLRTVSADPGQLEQVLLNLAINARDAMPSGGTITIRTENVTLTKDSPETHVELGHGKYVLLTVKDTGHGMEDVVVKHIFEPFFTTKEPGKGTGLGLSTVFGIVKAHQGHITCNSELGKGTAFRIYLPPMDVVTEPDVAMTAEMPAFGTETILLVDDENLIRNLGKEILEMAGYTVLTACNGQEALDLYRKKQADISLIILDLIMPKMGGRECLDELLDFDPNATVLIASGHAANGPVKQTLQEGAKGFISKPFETKEFLRIVRKVLGTG